MHVVIAVAGVLAVVSNRRFAAAGIESSRSFFGRELRPGSREYRFTYGYSRVMAVLVGSFLAVSGVLGAFGI
ncbi:hypothetical protein Aab01nite_62230 [Paractinoplanes abujensis]|nr:hypothetical protein Aab01nite_62230 [Actinoplanes abujensis]